MQAIIKLFCKWWCELLRLFCQWLHLGCHHGSGGSGSGCCCTHSSTYVSVPNHHYTQNCIKLLRKPKTDAIIGKGYHRSGWFYVVSELAALDSPDGILFDDFVEQNFCYNSNPVIYHEDWVGVFHHPPFPPSFSNKNEWMALYLNTPAFKESAKRLRLAITLTEYHREELAKYLTCPVVCIPHPIEDSTQGNFELWNPAAFEHHKKLIQVGFYLRNTHLIHQCPHIAGVKKMRLWTNREWVRKYNSDVVDFWNGNGNRSVYGGVHDMSFQLASNYDRLLAHSVIIMEVFDASASNGVLDCIVRNTPLIINRHPAVVEYLGENYPLYFDDPQEIPELMEYVYDAHEYLKAMDKTHLTIDFFTQQLMQHINEL